MRDGAVCRRDGVLDLADVVREWVRLYRADGVKRAHARAGQALQLSPRRVRAWWQGEVANVDALEAALILESRERLIEARIEQHKADLARVQATMGKHRAGFQRVDDLRAKGRRNGL